MKSINKLLIVTDSNIAAKYLNKILTAIPGSKHLILEPGEIYKNFASLERILLALHQQKFNRFDSLLALGGGVIGDLVGFAASIYMRGISWCYIPTTFIAQVDVAVGGKTGCNFFNNKNLLGSFYPAELVIVDPQLLLSLLYTEYLSGFAEVIKIAAVSDASLFLFLEQNIQQILHKDLKILHYILNIALKLKISLVESDPTDNKQRRLLNFGHTIGHALESMTDFNTYSHGFAVSIGMAMEAKLACSLGKLAHSNLDRLINLLVSADLPYRIKNKNITFHRLWRFMLQDKKNQYNDKIKLVILEKLGMATIQDIILDTQIIEALSDE